MAIGTPVVNAKRKGHSYDQTHSTRGHERVPLCRSGRADRPVAFRIDPCVAGKVPYNAEAEMKRRGARYEKAPLPFLSYAIEDGRLVTGQNPFSAKATAKKIVALLQGQ